MENEKNENTYIQTEHRHTCYPQEEKERTFYYTVRATELRALILLRSMYCIRGVPLALCYMCRTPGCGIAKP